MRGKGIRPIQAATALLVVSLSFVLLVPYCASIGTVFNYNPQPTPSNVITFEGMRLDPQTAKYVLADRFFKLCTKYNISAFVLDGALLGYLRYGNFLPWDHDIELRFVTAEDAARFMKHRIQILDALEAPHDGHLTLGRAAFPRLEYPGKGGDALGEGAKFCGHDINSCAFNEIGAGAWRSNCINNREQPQALACEPLVPTVMQGPGAHPLQRATVNMPFDIQGFGVKYSNGMDECQPNIQQCDFYGCKTISVVHLLFHFIRGSMPCQAVEAYYGGLRAPNHQRGFVTKQPI